MKKTILSILVLYVSLFLISCSKNQDSNSSYEVSESMNCSYSPPRITKFNTKDLAIEFIDDKGNEINYTPKLNKWYGDYDSKYKIKSLNKVNFGFFLKIESIKEFDSCQ